MVWAEEPLKITVPVPETKLVLFSKSQSPPIEMLLLWARIFPTPITVRSLSIPILFVVMVTFLFPVLYKL